MFVACLFTYVLPISFPPMSCVVATWLCVVGVMASPANHLGVRVTSASNVLGGTCVGAVLGATVVTLSQLVGPAFSAQSTAVLGVLAPVVLAVLAPARVAVSPPLLWAQGMQSCLAFGLTALTTYAQAGISQAWYIAGTLVLANTVAAVVVVLVAGSIVPTHATQEVQSTLADTLLHCGVATSRYAGRLFRPPKKAAPTAPSASTSTSGSLTGPADKAPAGVLSQLPAGALEVVTAAPASSSLSEGTNNSSSNAGWVAGGVGDSLSSAQQPAAAAASGSSSAGLQGLGSAAADDASPEAEAEAALAAADMIMEQLAAVNAADVAASGYAADDDGVQFKSSQGLGSQGSAEPLPLVMQEAHTEQEWLQLLRRTSGIHLTAPDASSHPQPTPPISSLRPRLAKAQTLFLSAAGMEPQWLRGGWGTVVARTGCYWFDGAAWGKAAACLQVLLTRLSALEAVIEDGHSLHTTQNPSINPRLLDHISLVYSKAASSLAHMSQTVHAYGSSSSIDSGISYSRGGSSSSSSGPVTPPGPEGGTGKDTHAQLCPVSVVCGRAGEPQYCWQQAKRQLAAQMQEECEDHWAGVLNAAADSPIILPTLTGIRHIMFTWSLTNATIDALTDLEQAVTAAVCAQPSAPSSSSSCVGLLHRLLGWVLPTLPMLTGRDLMVFWYNMLCRDLPRQLKQGWPSIRSMLASPVTQAACKYWLVLVIVLEVTLVSMHAQPVLRPLNPSFGFVAASLTISQKVEATVSKFVFWAAGTLLGGALGFLAMWHPALALSPYGLVAVTVAVAFVVGLLGVTKARVGITLTLMTLSSLILCQCCGHVGSWSVAAARVVSVLFGVTLSVLVCNTVLPWYTSSWSIQTMTATFASAVGLINQMHAQFYSDGAAAVAAFEATCRHSCGSDKAGEPAAAAQSAAAEIAAAACKASAGVAAKGPASCPVQVTPAVLQSLIARPLVAVQTSLLMDTVAWQRGVLATPPVVPALLRAMFDLLDRLAGLQLALHPPSITATFTGAAVVSYGVPMAGKLGEMLCLAGELAAAVVDVLEDPSCEHSARVQEMNAALQCHRVSMYAQMQHIRQQFHLDIHQQHRRLQQLLQEQQLLRQQGQGGALDAQICPVKRQMAVVLGGVDDTVRYMTFQFASIKTINMLAAVAQVACRDACRARSTAACTLR